MSKEEIKKILSDHQKWLITKGKEGERADFTGAYLWHADLRGANLKRADLSNASLWHTDLRGVDLREADLRNADLWHANLYGANLYGADLREADLRGADLRYAELKEADLRGSDLDYSCLPLCCGGQFIADNRICKQLVAHVLRILELSGEKNEELLDKMREYKADWHREKEF